MTILVTNENSFSGSDCNPVKQVEWTQSKTLTVLRIQLRVLINLFISITLFCLS